MPAEVKDPRLADVLWPVVDSVVRTNGLAQSGSVAGLVQMVLAA